MTSGTQVSYPCNSVGRTTLLNSLILVSTFNLVQATKGAGGLANAYIDFFVKSAVLSDGTAQVFKQLQACYLALTKPL